MPLKDYTDADIARFKVASIEAGHAGRVLVLHMDEPIEETVVLSPLSRAEWAAFMDARSQDGNTANQNVMLTQLLAPGFQEIEAMRQEWATLPEKIAGALLAEAGGSTAAPIVERLTPQRRPIGLSVDAAEKLLSEHKGVKLWSAQMPAYALSCVMKLPPSDVWLAARTLDDDARAAGKGIVAATEPYVLGSVVWSMAPLCGGNAGILDIRPALYWDLLTAYKLMGGTGANVRRQSF